MPTLRLNPSLIQKGLRHLVVIPWLYVPGFESFPDSEGIKTDRPDTSDRVEVV